MTSPPKRFNISFRKWAFYLFLFYWVYFFCYFFSSTHIALDYDLETSLNIVSIISFGLHVMQITGLLLVIFSHFNQEQKDYQFFVPLIGFVILFAGRFVVEYVFSAI